jgi:hypothetical protein
MRKKQKDPVAAGEFNLFASRYKETHYEYTRPYCDNHLWDDLAGMIYVGEGDWNSRGRSPEALRLYLGIKEFLMRFLHRDILII